ncbi:MAG: hypothetical protein JJU28_16165 [Cyclobacteriaceae bacterium]|nr:hypothetical protein [Cyclobacteriaceae bacterium]
MADFSESVQQINDELACINCGAMLKFKPGTLSLICEYCGTQNDIKSPEEKAEIVEFDLETYLAQEFEKEEKVILPAVKCQSCGATSTLDKNISSDHCPFCDAALVITSGTTCTIHKPHYVLPFFIDEKIAVKNFKKWLKNLWFAPKDLMNYADTSAKLNGMYLPYWTFDCDTTTRYTGQKGINYTVHESYTVMEGGRSVTKTRPVTKTRWYPAAGSVKYFFDDLLIEATKSLPGHTLQKLKPWDLEKLENYDDRYLSGFRTETYQVDLRSGYKIAKNRMEPIIRERVRMDIGGDRQNIHYISTEYKDPAFKHILLPVFISAYKYNKKLYQFAINGRTGAIIGERPYSAKKITLAILGGLAFIGVLYLILSMFA